MISKAIKRLGGLRLALCRVFSSGYPSSDCESPTTSISSWSYLESPSDDATLHYRPKKIQQLFDDLNSNRRSYQSPIYPLEQEAPTTKALHTYTQDLPWQLCLMCQHVSGTWPSFSHPHLPPRTSHPKQSFLASWFIFPSHASPLFCPFCL